MAILQTDNARLRLARLDTELALTQEQDERLNAQLAVLAEEIALLGQLRAAKNAAAEEQKTFAEEIKTARRQAATDRQKALEQLTRRLWQGSRPVSSETAISNGWSCGSVVSSPTERPFCCRPGAGPGRDRPALDGIPNLPG